MCKWRGSARCSCVRCNISISTDPLTLMLLHTGVEVDGMCESVILQFLYACSSSVNYY